jgi:hypothetical protein
MILKVRGGVCSSHGGKIMVQHVPTLWYQPSKVVKETADRVI